ncbi:MAG: TetR/AcrR family transcriptional regulator [Myxococcota bacterium]
MARPREFDEDDVVESAMRVFWDHGYEATSIRDLMLATGLAKGSVYKAFGDKRSLFRAALERYLDEGEARLRTLVETKTGEDALREWLLSIAALAARKRAPRGCFAVNTSIEVAPHDPEVRKLLRTHTRRVEAHYARAIEQGIDEGAFRSDLDPEAVAKWIFTFVHGLQARARAGIRASDAHALMEQTLRALR